MKHWYTKHFLTYLLLPFSLLFSTIVAIRRYCYLCGILKVHRFNVPVIVVGNITVGGTGKTPFVITIANWLKKQGYSPGIVSRGYKATTQLFPHLVCLQDDAKTVGDEAKLMADRTSCPVVIDPKRSNAINYLLDHCECDVIISDDGLQHYAFFHDIEILLIDGERQFGNGQCLPAGPLREPLSRLTSVDFIVEKNPKSNKHFSMQLIADKLYRLNDHQEIKLLKDLKGTTVHAVAGIAHPKQFFDLLRSFGLNVIEHPFKDHYAFQSSDLYFDDEHIIIMTEKDGVKCESFKNEKVWVLPLNTKIDAALGHAIIKKIRINQ